MCNWILSCHLFAIILYLTCKIQGILENYRQRKIRKVLADVNMCRSLSLKKIMYFQGKGDERRLSNKERWHTNAVTAKWTLRTKIFKDKRFNSWHVKGLHLNFVDQKFYRFKKIGTSLKETNGNQWKYRCTV